jgi:protocatechuate 3,4-dioxygenase, alpha subunit
MSNNAAMRPVPTQTIGPYPHEAWSWTAKQLSSVVGVPITGQIFDGAGAPVNDGWIEAWCPATKQWQRCPTGDQGEFRIELPTGQQQLMITVFGRGITRQLFTLVAISGDASILAKVPADKRASLIAKSESIGYRWDVHLQGAHETVFFDFE